MIGTPDSEVPHSSVCEVITVCGGVLPANWTFFYTVVPDLTLEALLTEEVTTSGLMGINQNAMTYRTDKLLNVLLELIKEHKLPLSVGVFQFFFLF